ncbi:MAG: butyrate kinase [bacterium]|nr:butyrate kinase [bacterium]
MDVVFIINPGSTSTKVAIANRDGLIDEKEVQHPREELAKFPNVADQLALRMETVRAALLAWYTPDRTLIGIVGRGAPLKPLTGGTYQITEAMLDDVRSAKFSNHASNLGSMLADAIAKQYSLPAFVVDPVTVDEFPSEVRLSGDPEIPRLCRWHALNLRACARLAAAQLGKPLSDTKFVAVHLGGGISIAALLGGRVQDVNDGLLGMGPFSPERAGALPIGGVLKQAFSGRYTERQLIERYSRGSGFVAYLGTSDFRKVEQMMEAGDEKAITVYKAFVWQLVKEIGAMAAVLGGVDGIVRSGGLARSQRLLADVSQKTGWIAPNFDYPGEHEMSALAAGAFRVLDGKESALTYQ